MAPVFVDKLIYTLRDNIDLEHKCNTIIYTQLHFLTVSETPNC